MKQLLPYAMPIVGFGASTHGFPVAASPKYDVNGTRSFHALPMPWAATFRNLVITSHDPGHPTATLTLRKDDADTALTVTLPDSSDGPAKNTTDEASFAALDDFYWVFQLPQGPGYTYGICVECDSPGMVFGISGTGGAATVGAIGVGGALGNGFWQSATPAYSTSVSICSIFGRITHMAVRTHATPPGVGEGWYAVVRLNLVEQDGTGGTVDTRCTIVGDGSEDSALVTFDLPIVPGDKVELVYYRTGANHAFEVNGQLSVAIGIVPTTDGQFMLTGGSNNALGGSGFDAYTWTRPEQSQTVSEELCQVPIGRGGIRVTGAYIEAEPPGTDPADQATWTLRQNGADTLASIVLQQLTSTGSITGLSVRYGEDDFINWQGLATGGSAPDLTRLYWGLAVESLVGTGVIGPLAWVHRSRRVPTSPATVETDSYSDLDMQCPAAWENGFKRGLVTRWGTVERASSHPWTGEWQGSTFDYQIAETSHRFRAQLASADDRYWNEAETVRMTTRENRADLGTPYTVFVGPIVDAQPSNRDEFHITLGDVVSQGMLSDNAQVPWRMIRDGFLSQMVAVSESLDRDAPEPILYGQLIREATEPGSPTSDDGIRVKPIYLGIMQNDGLDFHVWMVAGHAVSDLEIFVDGVQQIELPVFSTWLIPHHSEFQSEFGAPYQDFVSDTYGNTRRYTLIWGNVGRTNPDACATGEKVLTAAVWGVEDIGDGSGNLLTDRFQQYKHFLINYVANQGPQSYQSGNWLTNPTWDLFDGSIEKVEEASFDAATVIGQERTITGYLGAAAIGLDSGDRASAKKWIADWNRSCGCRFIITHEGQMRIFLLHPTQAQKDAAILYTDAYEILEDSFRTEIAWDEHATAIQYKSDFDTVSGVWITSGVEEDAAESANYGRTIPSEPREYPFAPGLQAQHLAILEKRIRKHPPRYVRLSGTIGPDPVTGESLGYRDGGDYIRYEHYDAVQETREIRMAQVITCGIQVGARVPYVVAIDCEDLIDYDVDGSPGAP